MDLELQSVLDYGLESTVDLLNRGFSDYIVPIVLDLASLLHMAGQESIDLACSQVVFCDGAASGVALIARRGWTSRLAAMALVPQARGKGVGGGLMACLIEQAQARGERAMVLEVIEGNDAAVALYKSCGFGTLRRLLSYVASPDKTAVAEADVQDFDGCCGDAVDPREVARLVSAFGLPDLPWQISGESLASVGPPNVAYRLEGAYLLLSNPDAPQIAVRSLLVLPEARGRGRALGLLRAAMARHPHKTWRVPAHCPEEVGGLFERAGFARDTLSQFQMRLEWG